MRTRSKHPAVELLALVKVQDITKPGLAVHDNRWVAQWTIPVPGKTHVSLIAPYVLDQEEKVEALIALAQSGFHVVSGDEEDPHGKDSTTILHLTLKAPIPVRIEEDEQGYPRAVALQSFPSPFTPGLCYRPDFGGDAA